MTMDKNVMKFAEMLEKMAEAVRIITGHER